MWTNVPCLEALNSAVIFVSIPLVHSDVSVRGGTNWRLMVELVTEMVGGNGLYFLDTLYYYEVHLFTSYGALIVVVSMGQYPRI